MSPNNYLVYLYRAIAKYSLADYKGAIDDLDITIRMHPSDGAFYYRGMAHMQLKHKTMGCADLNQSASMGNAVAETEVKKYCK